MRALGFTTQLVERRFDRHLRLAPDEPALALCGFDNPQARSVLEEAGFATVFEAGLGDGAVDFRLIRTHSFPAVARAEDVWADESFEVSGGRHDDGEPSADAAALLAAYDDLRDPGVPDQCGLTRLAGVAVGALFVATVAAAVLISQTVRMVVDGYRPEVLNLDLGSP